MVTCFGSLALAWIPPAAFSLSAMLVPCPPGGGAVLSCRSRDSSSSRRLRGELQLEWKKGGEVGPPPAPYCGVAERDGPSAGAFAVSAGGGKQTDAVRKPA